MITFLEKEKKKITTTTSSIAFPFFLINGVKD